MQARVEDTVVRRGHFETSAHDARNLVRSRAKVFESADKDLNGVLSFEEFVHTLPKKFVSRRSGEELKRLFDITDVNGDGRVSKQEFFMSTLSLSSKMTGSGLEAVFRKYDRTKDTALDILEVRCMCDDMGFALCKSLHVRKWCFVNEWSFINVSRFNVERHFAFAKRFV